MGKHNTLFLVMLSCILCATVTGCGKEIADSKAERNSHDYGFKQLCNAADEQYEEVESPIEWGNNYSYVDRETNASIYGFDNPVEGHRYFAITEKGEVCEMTISEEKAEISCPDNIFSSDKVESIWGVIDDNQEAYAVWYEGG